MTAVFDSLLKYINNLLKPKRPPVWRTIKTNIPWFENRVDCIEGARDVLKIAGYSEEKQDSLEFPDYVQEPDKPKLYILTAELHMAKLELEMMSNKEQPAGNLHSASPQWQSSHQPQPQHTREMYISSQGYSQSHNQSMGVEEQRYANVTGISGAPYRANGTQPMRAGGPDHTPPVRAGGPSNAAAPVRAGAPNSTQPFSPSERSVSFAPSQGRHQDNGQYDHSYSDIRQLESQSIVSEQLSTQQ